MLLYNDVLIAQISIYCTFMVKFACIVNYIGKLFILSEKIHDREVLVMRCSV